MSLALTLKDYKKLILPSYLSDVQKQIIEDKSRASMILAGPGSGKTTVVVHRVAHLLMIEEIKPEKIRFWLITVWQCVNCETV